MSESRWVEIREQGTARLLCRYDPERRLVEIVRRGVKTVVDLTEYDEKDCNSGETVVE